ncbi:MULTISPECIES: glycosyltransferase [Marichromatium]|uniref:Glycosyltransferase involved in cell wall biosynthesis n=1 Tax=Marichromatium gracile TaxID=1048 RepID=A0A4R4A8C1_MARGR|nr:MULTISPECIES: glycosyltransferase [Marichromatium]MBK1707987.1 glycosyl transferase family 2 [Marichromatium gracile]MBO8084808.1 glycosyltransferase [Marichromatium sp.]RNE93283.1 glycosyltransferase [Marichromatium sp. AB32]TCW35113.1 glycosyltransferase involved in cell wall biosynthesis [Marichromatium gracile]
MQPNAPDGISVIMPCYNCARFVAEAVDSVLAQTHPAVELIVVDDGSSDDSLRILEGYGARIRLLRQPNRGPYVARNLALRHAEGRYLAFLDADDWWLPETLERLHRALREAEADIAYCGWQNVGEGIRAAPHVPPERDRRALLEHAVRSCPWPIHGVLVRSALVQGVGGFSERRRTAMDYDLWLRLLGLTDRVVRVPEVLAFYRWHDSGQISAVKWRQVLDAWEVQRRFVAEHPGLLDWIPARRLRALIDDQLRDQAYRALWRRDLVSAQRLFRHALRVGALGRGDIVHALGALLPGSLYRALIGARDRGQPAPGGES